MKITRNFIKIFLLIFIAVLILNIITPFFNSWHYLFGSALAIMILITGLLVTRKNNKIIFYTLTYLLIVVFIASIFCPIYFYVQDRQVDYSYDIGSISEKNNSYLYPADRISSIKENQSNRELLAQLVYFNAPNRRFAYVNVSLNVLDEFPKNSTMILALKKDSKWNYLEHLVFNQTVQNSTHGNWTILTSTFSLDEAYKQNKTLTFLINIPHLGDIKTKQDYISIDWINLTYFN